MVSCMWRPVACLQSNATPGGKTLYRGGGAWENRANGSVKVFLLSNQFYSMNYFDVSTSDNMQTNDQYSQRSTENLYKPTYNTQYPTYKKQHPTYNKQHTSHHKQQTTYNRQHTTSNTQQPTNIEPSGRFLQMCL